MSTGEREREREPLDPVTVAVAHLQRAIRTGATWDESHYSAVTLVLAERDASLARLSDERLANAVRRAHDLLRFCEKTPLDPWVNQRAPLMCDYVIAFAGEISRLREERDEAREALREIAKGPPHLIDGKGVWPSDVARAALAAASVPDLEGETR